MEDPGIEALRGTFGTMSSIIRARSARKMSQSSRHASSSLRARPDGLPSTHANNAYDGLTRHQLYDAPVPRLSETDRASSVSSGSTTPYSPRRPAIKFGSQDLVHSYRPPGSGDADATHEHRDAVHSTPPIQTKSSFQYPPPPSTSLTLGGSQSLFVPPRANDEPPAPTVSTMYHNPIKSDPFETPTTPTMTAFPSSSDMLPHNSPPRSYRSQEDLRPTERTRRGSSTGQSRRYPRGLDDEEESISLWEQASPVQEMSEEEVEDSSPPAQGIRLVKPSSKTWI